MWNSFMSCNMTLVVDQFKTPYLTMRCSRINEGRFDHIKSLLHLISIAEIHINIASCGYLCLKKSIAGF